MANARGNEGTPGGPGGVGTPGGNAAQLEAENARNARLFWTKTRGLDKNKYLTQPTPNPVKTSNIALNYEEYTQKRGATDGAVNSKVKPRTNWTQAFQKKDTEESDLPETSPPIKKDHLLHFREVNRSLSTSDIETMSHTAKTEQPDGDKTNLEPPTKTESARSATPINRSNPSSTKRPRVATLESRPFLTPDADTGSRKSHHITSESKVDSPSRRPPRSEKKASGEKKSKKPKKTSISSASPHSGPGEVGAGGPDSPFTGDMVGEARFKKKVIRSAERTPKDEEDTKLKERKKRLDEFKMKLKKREEQQKRRSIEQPKAIPKEEEKKINLQLITQEWKNKKNLLKKAQEQKSNPSLLSDAPKDSPKPDKLSEKPEVTHVPSPLPKPGANLDNFVPKVPLKVEHEDSGDDEDRLQKILEALPLNHLTVVDLKAMGLEDPDVSQVLSGLITNKSVTTLLLDGNEMDTHSFNNLNEVLLKNQVLNHICLNFVVLGENGALAIQSGLSKNHSVTYLSLVGSDLFENGMAALAVGLKQNSTITVLNLSENSISDTGCNYLSELFDENSTITNLNISNNYINEEGATYLSNIITKNSSLTSLNLERNSIEDGGCIAISDALKENSTLKELYLGNNILETWGMKVLADSLADNQGLEVVDLRENIFEIESEIALQDAMMRRKGKLNVLWRKGKGEVEMSKSDMSAIIEYFGPTQIIDTFKKNMNLLPLVDIELVLNHIKYERTEALMMWEISFNQGSGYCHPLQLLNNILKIQTADSVSNKDFCTIFMENLDRICKILKPEPTDRVLHFKKLQTFQLTKNIIKTDDPAVSIAVLKSPLLNNITDLFFQFPNNSIFLTEFVDLLEHLLFSPSPSSFNLLSFLFVQSGFFHKLITNFLSESDSDFTSRKGYFGHMTKIFNKTKEAASKNPKFEKIFEAFPLWPQLVEKLEEINAVTITPAHLKPPENTNKKSALNEFDDSVM